MNGASNLAPRWVPTVERMPEEGKDVLVSDGTHVMVGHLGVQGQWYCGEDTYAGPEFSHWMSLPVAPLAA